MEYHKHKDYELSAVDKERNQLVSQSNKFIRETQNNLTLQQQKIILYIISKIKPNDDDLKDYEIDIKDFCKVCGIDEHHSNNHKYLRESIMKLHTSAFWFKKDKEIMLLSWINRVSIHADTNKITFRLDDRMKPYLLELQSNFTAYELGNALVLSSKYAIRLYEILKSYAYYGDITFTIEDIREHLQIDKDKYPLFNDFKRYIIDKSIAEINKYTDIYIEYTTRRSGRTTKYIDFVVIQKESTDKSIARFTRDSKLYKVKENE